MALRSGSGGVRPQLKVNLSSCCAPTRGVGGGIFWSEFVVGWFASFGSWETWAVACCAFVVILAFVSAWLELLGILGGGAVTWCGWLAGDGFVQGGGDISGSPSIKSKLSSCCSPSVVVTYKWQCHVMLKLGVVTSCWQRCTKIIGIMTIMLPSTISVINNQSTISLVTVDALIPFITQDSNQLKLILSNHKSLSHVRFNFFVIL